MLPVFGDWVTFELVAPVPVGVGEEAVPVVDPASETGIIRSEFHALADLI